MPMYLVVSLQVWPDWIVIAAGLTPEAAPR